MTIRKQVEAILSHVEDARSSDKLLQVIYMQKCGMNLTPEQIEVFKKMPDLWTVRRCRQKIQEEGLFPATKAVEEKRYDNYVKVKHGVEYKDPAEILNIKDTVNKLF